MQQAITGFHQDQEGHWATELACGHTQHVKHEPPLASRLWVLDPGARRARLATTLNCLLCDAALRGETT